MNKSKKFGVFLLVICIGIFGYSQYASASQINVIVTQSELIDENKNESKYDIELKFQNPTFLVLTAGETEFYVLDNEDVIGNGILESFVLPSLGSSLVKGTFTVNSELNSESIALKISGVTKYDIGMISIDVPFDYYPSEEQAREFIDSN